MRASLFAVLLLVAAPALFAQNAVEEALQRRLIDPELPLKEVQEFCEHRVTPMPEVESVEQWEAFARQMRQSVFDRVVYRGQAADWSQIPTRVEYLDTIDAAPEYRIRKLRFEAVPGMWIPALLYEPKNLTGPVPVVLNVNGHDGNGKAADYKQTRCINQAKRGMLALNLEWVGMGQLRTPGFTHYKMNQLDLCGTSGLSPFYLSMKRGLDILLEHPNADPKRVAVAGLSGGGWQTIFISALDERVTLSNPVAGYSSFKTRSRFQSDLGDSEQTPNDLGAVSDYELLTALRAPHATLLTNNAQDQCCFKAEHAQPPLVEAAGPIYKLYDKSAWLRTHVNHDPGSHNFEQDNRQQLYKMLGDYFYGGLQPVLIRLDGDALRQHGLTVEDVQDALGEFAYPYVERSTGFFAELQPLVRQQYPDFAGADLVVLLSRHFRGETPETLDATTVPTAGGAVTLKQLAQLSPVALPHADPNYSAAEIACEGEIKTAEELNVPLPDENEDFHTLALGLAKSLPEEPAIPQASDELAAWTKRRRGELAKVVAAHDWEVYALLEREEERDGLTVRYWWLRVGGLWTLPATEFVPRDAGSECVLLCSEKGRGQLAAEVQAELSQQKRVIAFDPFYFGESTISKRDFLYGLLVATTGQRPLGVQASQIAALARWARRALPDTKVAVRAVGPRTSLAALVASGLEPRAISRLVLEQPYGSLREIVEQDLAVNQSPELFCFGLLQRFDVPQLLALSGAESVRVVGATDRLRKALEQLPPDAPEIEAE